MISNVKSTEGVGSNVLKKTIHKGSESIMFSVLQETQYMYPFKSAVREIVSNSLDSVNEKINALKILDGEIKVSDLFIEKEGTEFLDSTFNAAYYDRKWLSEDTDVTIRYIENDTKTRDRIQFIDSGVGLGGDRLVKYFSLGFSTKRLSKTQLGNFGLGAKSLLATGVDKYRVISRYNGQEFAFDVYKDHVVSIVEKFEEDGTINEMANLVEPSEEEAGFSCYYRKTKELNNVTIEAEVKRHRKNDYVLGIQNQLGFIDNIKFVTQDKNYGGADINKNIKGTVKYSKNNIIVGDRDYYAVPQILLRPGPDSNIKINYGPINFDELEMKKYTGNVGFVMNINNVDVTPSRESVIWNSRTRDAIKSMFLEAQKTITEEVKIKISTATNLVDHIYLLAGMKSRSSNSSLQELYKIIDTSEIDIKYKTFNIGQAASSLMSSGRFKDNLVFTSTNSHSGYNNQKTEDTNYSSSLSNDYLSRLSSMSTNNVIVYIGKTKSKGLARYVRHKYSGTFSYGDSINIIYVRDTLYAEVAQEIKDSGGMEKFLTKSYNKGLLGNILIAEVIRYATSNSGAFVLLEDDVDKSKLQSLGKEEEEGATKQRRYMTEAEKAKLAGKVIGNYHTSPANTYRKYYDETKARSEQIIIYNLKDPIASAMSYSHSYEDFCVYNIVGFSEENFKRFYKLKGVKLLTSCLYTIEFGDLKLTKLGKLFLPYSVRNEISARFDLKQKSEKITLEGALSFLEGVFRNIHIEKEDFDNDVAVISDRIRDRIKEEPTREAKAIEHEKQITHLELSRKLF